MKQNKKFLRQCAICKEIKNKSDLIRLTKDYKTMKTYINQNSKIQGRSVYICKNSICLEKALKNKKIESFLNLKADENIKEELYNLLKN